MNFAEHLKQTLKQEQEKQKKGTVKFWKNEKGYYVKSITFKIGSKMVTKNSIFWDYDKLQKSISESIKSGYTHCN